MGKLKALKPLLSVLRPTIAYAGDPASGRVIAPPAWKAWYNTAHWRQLRIACLTSDVFCCQHPKCPNKGKIQSMSKLVADHKIPHRGNRALFFDIDNLWTLCIPCHSSVKQIEERATPAGVWD